MRKLPFLLSLLAVLGCAPGTSLPSKKIVTYPDGSEYRAISGAPAPQGAAVRMLSLFQCQGNIHMDYFGAFAASPQGRFHWSGNVNTLETAQQIALQGCNAHVLRGEERCALMGVLVPRGYVPTDGLTLGESGSRAFRRYQAARGAKAFARSPAMNWAVSKDRVDVDAAISNARRGCEIGLHRGPPARRQPCEIVLVSP